LTRGSGLEREHHGNGQGKPRQNVFRSVRTDILEQDISDIF
jgi:hypothetical protein